MEGDSVTFISNPETYELESDSFTKISSPDNGDKSKTIVVWSISYKNKILIFCDHFDYGFCFASISIVIFGMTGIWHPCFFTLRNWLDI